MALSKDQLQERDFGTLQQRIEQLHRAARVSQAAIEGDLLRLQLPTGVSVSVPIRLVRSLKSLSPEQVAKMLVTDGGRVLLWPSVGVSIDVEALLEGAVGVPTPISRPA